VKHGNELAEEEDAMLAVDRFAQQFIEQFELGGGIFFLETNEAEIATDLA
jgi:hypothetical protein